MMESRSDEAALRFVESLFEAKNARDYDRLVGFFTEDVEYTDLVIFSRARGRDELRMGFQAFLGGNDARFDVLSVVGTLETGVAIEWVDGPPSLGPNPVRGTAVIELRDGLIRSWRDVWDGSLLAPELLQAVRSSVREASGERSAAVERIARGGGSAS